MLSAIDGPKPQESGGKCVWSPKKFQTMMGIFFGYIGHILDEHSLLQLL